MIIKGYNTQRKLIQGLSKVLLDIMHFLTVKQEANTVDGKPGNSLSGAQSRFGDTGAITVALWREGGAYVHSLDAGSF